MDPKQIWHRYLATQSDALLAKLGGNGSLPDQTAGELAGYRARLEANATEAARRTKGSH